MLDNFIYYLVNLKLKKYFKRAHENIRKNYYISNKKAYSNKIWFFWWQGINEMPPIVQSCLRSIKVHSNNHEVIIITKYNVKEYADIPDYIYDKLRNNKISITHFSDILRFNLLYNNGGLWVDSTLYCFSSISDCYFKNIYTSFGTKTSAPYFINGKWTGFLIGGQKNNSFFNFMNEFFKEYWKYNDSLLHYLIIDFAIDYCYKENIGNLKKYIDSRKVKDNKDIFFLSKILNKKYDEKLFNLMILNNYMSKVTYKHKYDSDNDTFYNRVVHCKHPFK